MVFVKNVPKVKKANPAVIPQEEQKESSLTPAQRLKLRKEQEALRQAELMKQGALEARENFNFASAKKNA